MKKVLIPLICLLASCKKQDSTCHVWLVDNYAVQADGHIGDIIESQDTFCYDAGITRGLIKQVGSGTGGVKIYKKYIREIY